MINGQTYSRVVSIHQVKKMVKPVDPIGPNAQNIINVPNVKDGDVWETREWTREKDERENERT